jgi:GDPmannose 4,6-dehydratase
MRKAALIAGITEQAGSCRTDLFLAKGCEVRGLKCRSSSFNTDRIDHLYVDSHTGDLPLLLHYCDITDTTSINPENPRRPAPGDLQSGCSESTPW